MRRALFISILLYPCLLWADSIEDVARFRLKNGIWLAPSVTTGSLEMKAPTAQSTIRLTALLGAFGFEHWTEDALGVYAQGYAGIPATISNVLGSEISFTRHQVDLGIGFRRFSTLRASSAAWIAASNLRIGVEQVQEQGPAILLSRLLLAPGLKVGYETVLPSANLASRNVRTCLSVFRSRKPCRLWATRQHVSRQRRVSCLLLYYR